jgi:hypothetical protein
MAVLGGLMVGAPITALHAANRNVAVEDIQIVGTPKLFVERPGTGSGYDSAWVIFRTRPHLQVVRQVVTDLRGLRGRSYTADGALNCVRSTVIHAAPVVKPGARYRVRFYARKGRSGKAGTLVATRTLLARRFDASRNGVPRCGS